MATCQATIEGALRKLGKLGAGRAARTVDLTDGLASLKGLYNALIDAGSFGPLRDVIPTADYTAGENERVFRTSEAVLNVNLPLLVEDAWFGDICEYGSRWVPEGSTNPNQRPPRDGTVVVVSDAYTGVTEEYLYDGQERAWRSLSDLALADEAPLSRRDPDGLQAMLARQMADQFGDQLPNGTARLAQIFQSNLVSRWSMPRRTLVGSYM